MYQALYRKWRPQTFDEVTGQDHITQTLKNQVAASRVSHAYLFTGTRGTGKTTCAKLLARAVNCENPKDGNPCGQCPSCRGILDGSILDILELDAASNTGVDNMRAILEETVYPPANVKKRVYIIDEVHMLSAGAFNALLKTLEEPPDYVMFILATTELNKVAATVQSRCQRFDFKRIPQRELAANLSRICDAESIRIAPDALSLLARLADGSARDSLSLLERCLSQNSDGTIDLNAVIQALGVSDSESIDALARAIAENDSGKALKILDKLYMDGKELRTVLESAAVYFRDILLLQTAPDAAQNIISPENDTAQIRETSAMFSPIQTVAIISQLQKTIDQLSRSSAGRLESEMCLILLCNPGLLYSSKNETPAVTAQVNKPAVSKKPQKPVEKQTEAPAQIKPEQNPETDTISDGPPPLSDDDLPPWDESEFDVVNIAPHTETAAKKPDIEPVINIRTESEKADKSDKGSLYELLDSERKKELINCLKPKLSRSVSTYMVLSRIFIPDGELIISVESEIAKVLLDKNNIKSDISDAVKQLWNETRRVSVCIGDPSIKAKPDKEDGFSQIISSGRDAGVKINLV